MKWTDFYDMEFPRVRAALEKWRPELARQLECHPADEQEVRFIFSLSHQLHEGAGVDSEFASFTLDGAQVEYVAKALALLGYFTLDKMDDPKRAAGAGITPSQERLTEALEWSKRPLADGKSSQLPSGGDGGRVDGNS
jgi:hypothetical protein